jgi:cell division protein FtsI/penicillin-binding protein 2
MITKGPPIRGNIYDSAGQQIAYSISTQSLYFTFKTGFKQEAAEALDAKLVQLFNEKGEANSKPLTTEEVIEAMDIKGRAHLPFQQRRIKSGLSKEEIAYLSEHRDEYPDMEIVEERIRQYSPDRVAVQLVGYMNKMKGAKENLDFYKEINADQSDPTLKYLDSEEVGYDGIELMYQKEMRGLNGYKSYQIDSMSRIVGDMKLTKPVKGQNLYLTINRKVQLTAQQAILDQIATTRLNTQPAGEILQAVQLTDYESLISISVDDYD